jgi:hypothetical protein
MADGAAGSYLDATARARLRWAVHQLVGIAVGGVLGAAFWLVVVQEGRNLNHTDLDFVRAMALIFEADGTDRRSTGSAGLYLTLGAGVLLVLLHALLLPRVPRLRARCWWIQSIPVGLVAYVLWGVLVSPSRDAGAFGLDAGGVSSSIVFLVGAAAFAIVAIRCYSLIASAGWWEDKEQDITRSLDEIEGRRRSLELAEQGPEQGRVRAGS